MEYKIVDMSGKGVDDIGQVIFEEESGELQLDGEHDEVQTYIGRVNRSQLRVDDTDSNPALNTDKFVDHSKESAINQLKTDLDGTVYGVCPVDS